MNSPSASSPFASKSQLAGSLALPVWAPGAKRILFADFDDIRTANPYRSKGKKVGHGFAPAWGRRP